MTAEPKSSLQRALAAIAGDPDGSRIERALHYVSRAVAGGLVGFFVVAAATPSRDHPGAGFGLEIYLGAVAAGAVLGLGLAVLPRLLHPKDWPTREEFRRGGAPSRKDPPGA